MSFGTDERLESPLYCQNTNLTLVKGSSEPFFPIQRSATSSARNVQVVRMIRLVSHDYTEALPEG